MLILSAFLVMAASLVGVIAVWRRAGHYIEDRLDLLVSFSAGVFLVFAYQVAHEAVERLGSVSSGLGWMFAGAAVVWLIFKLIPDSHEHSHAGHGHTPLDARRLLFTDAVHNIADGVFLAASYMVSVPLGIAATIGVVAHEMLQEISEFFVLRDAGYSTKGALYMNFLVSSGIMVGAVGGYYLLGIFEALEGPLLATVAGGIIVVVLHDLLPHSVREAGKHLHFVQHIVWFAVGISVMFAVTQFVSHAHEEAVSLVQEGILSV